MPWLFDDPTPLIIVGLIVEAILAIILVRSGRAMTILPMIGVLVLMVAVIAVEHFVVTEREEVSDTLDALAVALEANDTNAVANMIDPAQTSMRSRATGAMGLVTITESKIRGLKVTVNELTTPHTATADFVGHIAFRNPKMDIPYETVVRRFVIDMKRQGDRWIMTDYQVGDPTGKGALTHDPY